MTRKTAALLVLSVGLLIEALLALRLWLQVTSEPIQEEWQAQVLDLTDVLASPFQIFTGTAPNSQVGIVDFTVLVALEGYFAAVVLALAVIYLAGRVAQALRARPKALPAFIAEMERPPARYWQPIATQRATLYVTWRRGKTRPRYARAGLG